MSESKVSFALRKIITKEFAIIEKAFIENETIQISLKIDFKIDPAKYIIGCFARFEFEIKNSPLIIIEVICEFNIENNAWLSFIDIEKQQITFQLGLIRHLALLTIGTTRGVLHAKTENTIFNRFLLPTINVNEILTSDISFPLNPESNPQ